MTEKYIKVKIEDVEKAVAALPNEEYGEGSGKIVLGKWPNEVITGDMTDEVWIPAHQKKVIYVVPYGYALVIPINVLGKFDFGRLLFLAGIQFEIVKVKHL